MQLLENYPELSLSLCFSENVFSEKEINGNLMILLGVCKSYTSETFNITNVHREHKYEQHLSVKTHRRVCSDP